jgi:hypothetical protein
MGDIEEELDHDKVMKLRKRLEKLKLKESLLFF